jgi:hypothetical protein
MFTISLQYDDVRLWSLSAWAETLDAARSRHAAENIVKLLLSVHMKTDNSELKSGLCITPDARQLGELFK